MRARRQQDEITAVRAFARALAVFAMLVQVLFYADHVGALAAKSFGLAAPGDRLGFLEICTGNGIELVSLDGTPVPPGNDCPICENASVMAFGEPQALPAPVFPFVVVAADWDLAPESHQTIIAFRGPQPIRAPPQLAA